MENGAPQLLSLLPVQGIKSFTVINVTGNLRIDAGFTGHQKLSSDWDYIGDGKWDKVISCLSDDGEVYGKDFGPHTKKSYDLIPWNNENNYLNVGVLPNHIKFEVGKLFGRNPNKFSKSASNTVFFRVAKFFRAY